jgi:hypothetical protein
MQTRGEKKSAQRNLPGPSRDEADAHFQMMTAGYHATPTTPGFQHLLSVTYRNRADGTVRVRP